MGRPSGSVLHWRRSFSPEVLHNVNSFVRVYLLLFMMYKKEAEKTKSSHSWRRKKFDKLNLKIALFFPKKVHQDLCNRN